MSWSGDFILSVLGDPRFISLAALLVSLWSLKRTGRLTSLQTRIAGLELKNKERFEASRSHAEVRATLQNRADHSYRLILENVSGAPGTDVDIEFLEEKGAGIFPHGEREEKLPIPQLDPGASVPLIAALAMGRWPPFKIVLTWRDPDSTPQRRETILYDP